jgi:enamine deaminase RidA (YjgF/YER057c/UK114 family)
LSAEQRVRALGLVLPVLQAPTASYVPYLQAGDLLFLSGQGPFGPDGRVQVGKLGRDVSVATGYAHARVVGLQILSTIRAAAGSLDRVQAIVKLLGLVNAMPEFTEPPAVINGCSDLLIDVFGPQIGAHARSAIGVATLPGGMTVEIEAIIQLRA